MPRQKSTSGLFPSEAEIADRLCQTPKTWAGLAVVLEREGLPRIDPLLGARYWPAVRAFMDRRSGLSRATHVPVGPDGEETWQQ
jgi:hypothetical protein